MKRTWLVAIAATLLLGFALYRSYARSHDNCTELERVTVGRSVVLGERCASAVSTH